MRNPILIFMLATLCSCGGEPAKPLSAERSAVADTSALGAEIERTYGGTIPSPTGKVGYRLTLRNREHSGDGTYSLVIFSPGKERNCETAVVTRGKWGTLRGSDDDPDATVYQLNIGDTAQYVDFLYREEHLIMLGNARQRFHPATDYTLKRIDKAY